jgi:hypothetical protein
MSSLVLELQQEAMNPHTEVADILRKALVVATKLNIGEFRKWIEQELRGYESSGQIPEYRCVRGEVKVYNLSHGWVPVVFVDPRTTEKLSQRYIGQAIGEIENLLADDQKVIQVPYSPEILSWLRNSPFMQRGLEPTLICSRSQFYGIVEAV